MSRTVIEKIKEIIKEGDEEKKNSWRKFFPDEYRVAIADERPGKIGGIINEI